MFIMSSVQVCVSNPTLPESADEHGKATRLATALLKARSRAASLPRSYTTCGNTSNSSDGLVLQDKKEHTESHLITVN